MVTPRSTLSELFSQPALKLLSDAGGQFIIQKIGEDVIRDIVFNVFTGRNLRDSTEALTRRRIVTLNLALLNLFLNGASTQEDFITKLPFLAADTLTQKRIPKIERWLAQWVLGLTGKSVQNVLRDDYALVAEYRDQYIEACQEVIQDQIQEYGALNGVLESNSGRRIPIDWLFITYLLNAVGAQTLTIRGSEKSAYGKLFEKLILGALLSILDFKYVTTPQPENLEHVFWLSSRGSKRESDATLLYEAGKGVRFDIGFIGRGNTEISLDKVSRFERELSIGRSNWYMATFILVDRIPARSRIVSMADAIGGTIIQMSGTYWPQRVARELRRTLGYEHRIVDMSEVEFETYIRSRLTTVPFDAFITQMK